MTQKLILFLSIVSLAFFFFLVCNYGIFYIGFNIGRLTV